MDRCPPATRNGKPTHVQGVNGQCKSPLPCPDTTTMLILKQIAINSSVARPGSHPLLAPRLLQPRLHGHHGSAGRAELAGAPQAGQRHISPSAWDAKHCCSIHHQKEILNLPKNTLAIGQEMGSR